MLRIFFICFFIVIVDRGVSQDFVFPKEHEAAHLSGNNPVITERIPVYIPMRCPENMLLYPGAGDKSTWICDCVPGFLYFPTNNTCHEAYRQGPCPIGNYVYLRENDPVPICVENPCGTDGFVLYNGICQELGTSGSSCENGFIRVNSTNFQIECVEFLPLQSIINAPLVPCPTGSIRVPPGGCRKHIA